MKTDSYYRTVIYYLLDQIKQAVIDKDKDSLRSHLEELNLFCVENNLLYGETQ